MLCAIKEESPPATAYRSILPPEVANLKILPKKERKQKSPGHWMCKVNGCDKQGRSRETNGLCKGHFALFTKFGRSTFEKGEGNEVLNGKDDQTEDMTSGTWDVSASNSVVCPEEKRKRGRSAGPKNETKRPCRRHYEMDQSNPYTKQYSNNKAGKETFLSSSGCNEMDPSSDPYKKQYSGSKGRKRRLPRWRMSNHMSC